MYILLSTDFESDLQEVWSVRKNIHHTGQMLPRAVPSSVQVTAAGGQYSRHGAIPAQQSMKGHQALGTKDNSIKGACNVATFPGSSLAVWLYNVQKVSADMKLGGASHEAMYIVHVHNILSRCISHNFWVSFPSNSSLIPK